MRNQKEEFFELIYAQYAKKLERICLRYVNISPNIGKLLRTAFKRPSSRHSKNMTS